MKKNKEQSEINRPFGVLPEWMQELREAVEKYNDHKLFKNPREFARRAVETKRAAIAPEIRIEAVQ